MFGRRRGTLRRKGGTCTALRQDSKRRPNNLPRKKRKKKTLERKPGGKKGRGLQKSATEEGGQSFRPNSKGASNRAVLKDRDRKDSKPKKVPRKGGQGWGENLGILSESKSDMREKEKRIKGRRKKRLGNQSREGSRSRRGKV